MKARVDAEADQPGSRLSVAEVILRFLFAVQFGIPVVVLIEAGRRGGFANVFFIIIVVVYAVILIPVDGGLMRGHYLRRNDPKRFPWLGAVILTFMVTTPLL